MLADPDRIASAEGASEPPGDGSPKGQDVGEPPRTVAAVSGSRAAPSRVEDALAALSQHPRGDDLARLVHAVAFAAADERRTSFADGLGEMAERAELRYEHAETPFGNVL